MRYNRNYIGPVGEVEHAHLLPLNVASNAILHGAALTRAAQGAVITDCATAPLLGVMVDTDLAQDAVTPIKYGRKVHRHRSDDTYITKLEAGKYDVVSATGTTFVLASMSSGIVGGWVYVMAGPGIGQLRRVTGQANPNEGTVAAWTVNPTSDSDVWLIWPVLVNVLLTATGVEVAKQAAVQAATCPMIERSFISMAGRGIEELMAATFDSMDNLHLLGVEFSHELSFPTAI